MIKLRRLRWAGLVARMEEDSSDFKILTHKSTGKLPLGRPRRIWEVNIKINLKEKVSIGGIVLIRLGIGIIGEPL